MNTKTPVYVGTIVGSIVAICVLTHSPDWIPRFIDKTTECFTGSHAKYYEPSLVLTVFVGGGSVVSYLAGRLVSLFRRTKHDRSAS